MKILPADSHGIQTAVDILRRDGVVIHATETCYGIAGDLQSPGAVGRIFALKKRPLEQPLSALFHSWHEAQVYIDTSPRGDQIAEQYLPGPLTIVLPRRDSAPLLWVTPVHGGHDTMIGVRVSPHPIASELVSMFGWPIATTSANVHGQPNPYSLEEILSQFSSLSLQPDLILDSGTLPRTPPSTVVEVLDDRVRVLRAGDIVVE